MKCPHCGMPPVEEGSLHLAECPHHDPMTCLGCAELDEPRFYRMVRDVDETGNSGIGPVAEVARFSDGTTIVHWNKHTNALGTTSTVVYSSFEDAVKVHGHGGLTRFEELEDV